MKLLYIANARIPTEKAHGLQIMKMCEAFADQGIKVELIIPKRINSFKENPFSFYEVRKNFKIQKLPCLDFLWLPFFKTFSFGLESWSFAKAAAIYGFFKKSAIFYTRDALIVFFLSFLGKPVFYEIHVVPQGGLWLHGLVWQKSSGIIAISEGIKKELVNSGINPNKILVARDAVDLAKFQILLSKEQARKELKLPVNKKIAVYTGHLYDWKGAGLLAGAAKILPDMEIYLVGGTKDDIEKYKLKYQSSLLAGRQGNLKIVGWQPPQRIPLWLKAADVLVLPNSAKEKIGAEYTSPLKLFEYMASGTPIVASDVPALREVLGTKEAFFFVPDNEESLRQVIQRVFSDYGAAGARSRLAQEKVKEYTWNKRAGIILDFIKFYAR